MKKLHIFFSTLAVILLACSNDDGSNDQNPIGEPDPNNRAPESFNLIMVADNSLDVQPNPAFSWEATADPDGDTVRYDLYLDTQSDPAERFAENLDATTYTIPDSLALCRARLYNWKVVAKDGKGGETPSEVFSFTVKPLNDAERITPINPFSGRSEHAAVSFQGMWILGGLDSNGPSDHVWFSADGNDWTHVNANSSSNFPARFFLSATSFDNALWVVGGVGSEFLNDVWTSADGITWAEVDQVQEYIARAEHTLTVFQDRLWIIGGGGNGGVKLADVWSSADGATWELMTGNAPFGKRNFHQTVAFKDRLWVIGGNEEDDNANQATKNDVWSSSDGITWELETGNAGFSPRFGHKALVFDEKIWIVGRNGDSGVLNDFWYSEDGVEWFEATPVKSFDAKGGGFTAVYHDGKIWILGGSVPNGVWEIDYELGRSD